MSIAIILKGFDKKNTITLIKSSEYHKINQFLKGIPKQYYNFFSVALRPNAGLGLLILEVF
jgi:hypothetical protein